MTAKWEKRKHIAFPAYNTCLNTLQYILHNGETYIVYLHRNLIIPSREMDSMKHLEKSQRESASSWLVHILKKSPGSGRPLPLDCAEKHKDRLTPGSRIRDLPVCAEKLEGSCLGMTNRRRSKAVLENTVDLLTRILNAISDSRQMLQPHDILRMRNTATCQRLSPKSVRQIKNRSPVTDEPQL